MESSVEIISWCFDPDGNAVHGTGAHLHKSWLIFPTAETVWKYQRIIVIYKYEPTQYRTAAGAARYI
jgi:hypothetical protein